MQTENDVENTVRASADARSEIGSRQDCVADASVSVTAEAITHFVATISPEDSQANCPTLKTDVRSNEFVELKAMIGNLVGRIDALEDKCTSLSDQMNIVSVELGCAPADISALRSEIMSLRAHLSPVA
ncbi:hypothetical protein [Pseudogemmobacter sonorensis]|uniref:hypothetical protein n=1 Tax=Pseudogemmobacter sonorensis TaxID=2989681 RepID=UPI00368237E3